MVGERTGTRYRLGDTVTIVITRADVQARTLDFVLKDNGVYEPHAAKPAKANAAPKADAGKSSGKRRSRKKKGERKAEPIIADVEATPAERRKKTRGAHGTHGKRVQEGERAARSAAASVPGKTRAAMPKAASARRAGHSERASQAGAERRDRGSARGRGNERYGEERGQRDYHRVKVTGLNSAVWPDPPGYRAQRPEPEAAEKPRRAPRPTRRMNRKESPIK